MLSTQQVPLIAQGRRSRSTHTAAPVAAQHVLDLANGCHRVPIKDLLSSRAPQTEAHTSGRRSRPRMYHPTSSCYLTAKTRTLLHALRIQRKGAGVCCTAGCAWAGEPPPQQRQWRHSSWEAGSMQGCIASGRPTLQEPGALRPMLGCAAPGGLPVVSQGEAAD